MPHPDEQLTAYIDGRLDGDSAADVAAHLAECAQCRTVMEDLLAVRRLLRASPQPEPHPALLPRTLTRLPHVPKRSRVPGWVTVGVAAAAAVTMLLFTPSLPSPQSSERSARWHFQQHAEIALAHPLAETSVASYLAGTIPSGFVQGSDEVEDGP